MWMLAHTLSKDSKEKDTIQAKTQDDPTHETMYTEKRKRDWQTAETGKQNCKSNNRNKRRV
jgi:hypothetical protein